MVATSHPEPVPDDQDRGEGSPMSVPDVRIGQFEGTLPPESLVGPA